MGVVIIYGRGVVEKGGGIKFECKQLEGGGQNFKISVHRFGGGAKR